MRIGYPALGENANNKVKLSDDFTSSDLIGIYDSDTDVLELTNKNDLQVSITEWLKLNNINAIISPEMKLMALNIFREEGIQVYQAEGNSLSMNMVLLRSSMLELFSVAEVSSNKTNSCGSCSSCNGTSCT